MKKWTKKFLDKEPSGIPSVRARKRNAKMAQEKIKFPRELWLELSEGLPDHWRFLDAETLFGAGLAIGWAEHEESIK